MKHVRFVERARGGVEDPSTSPTPTRASPTRAPRPRSARHGVQRANGGVHLLRRLHRGCRKLKRQPADVQARLRGGRKRRRRQDGPQGRRQATPWRRSRAHRGCVIGARGCRSRLAASSPAVAIRPAPSRPVRAAHNDKVIELDDDGKVVDMSDDDGGAGGKTAPGAWLRAPQGRPVAPEASSSPRRLRPASPAHPPRALPPCPRSAQRQRHRAGRGRRGRRHV